MKIHQRVSHVLVIAGFIVFFSYVAPCAQNGKVFFNPDTTVVSPLDIFEVNIEVDSNVRTIHCFMVSVYFDRSSIQLLDVLEGPLLPGQGQTFPFWQDNGVAYDIGNCLMGYGLYADGPGVLAIMKFRAGDQAGVTPLTFTHVEFSDTANPPNQIPVNHSDGSVIVSGDQAPTIHVISPSSGGAYNYLPTLTIHFSDDVGLDRGYYQIDGCTGAWTELWSYNSNSSDTTIDWTVPSVSEGSHTIYFKVTDDAGNVNGDTCTYSWSFTYHISLVSILPDSLFIECNHEDTLWIHLDEKLVDMDSAFFKIAYEDSFITTTNVIKGPALVPPSNFDLYHAIYPDSILIGLAVLSGSFDGSGVILGIVLTAGNEACSTQLSIERSSLHNSDGQEIIHYTTGADIQIDCPTSVDGEDETTSQIPSTYGLSQNYPNPYNAQTQIVYQLPQAGEVSLKIYNIRGQLVRTMVDEHKPAGYHTVIWDGRNEEGMEVSSGVYFYKVKAGEFTQSMKMVILK